MGGRETLYAYVRRLHVCFFAALLISADGRGVLLRILLRLHLVQKLKGKRKRVCGATGGTVKSEGLGGRRRGIRGGG